MFGSNNNITSSNVSNHNDPEHLQGPAKLFKRNVDQAPSELKNLSPHNEQPDTDGLSHCDGDDKLSAEASKDKLSNADLAASFAHSLQIENKGEEKEEKSEDTIIPQLSSNYDSYWDSFNQEIHEVGVSYTLLFFDKFNLRVYLNNDCKNLFQVGASIGTPMDHYMQKGFKVMAYDYSPTSIAILKSKNIPAKQIDLNEIAGSQLAYSKDLAEDLSATTNILLIRILLYLKPEALKLFLYSIMDLAKPGSVFFIADAYQEHADEEGYPRNFIASYFGARTDMYTLFHIGTHDKDRQYKNKNQQHLFTAHPDEILIVRKIV